MSDSTTNLPEPWKAALEERERSARSVDAPSDAERADLDWFELYSKFGTKGFVRVTAGTGEAATELRLQFAVPASGAGYDIPSAVREGCADVLEGEWEILARDPEWRIGGTLTANPDADAIDTWFGRLEELSAAAESGDLSDARWLEGDRGESGAPSQRGSESTDADAPTSTSSREVDSEAAEQVFEPIGNDSSGGAPSSALQSVGIENWELLAEESGDIDVRLRLDATLPPADREKLSRELAHALRSRYDIAARPLPAETGDPSASAELRLRAKPAESGLDAPETTDEVRADLEGYLERLVRFEELGVRLASVLGLVSESDPGEESSANKERTARAQQGKRGRGRREASPPDSASGDGAENRSPEARKSEESSANGSGQRGRPSDAEQDEERVVLGLGGGQEVAEPETSAPAPESGLEPGNYRDPRLMREDATTSLVDIVLRHPGYAEEKMGHNLSILLSIDYPDAMELVHRAPSVIAWGVGRERALDFKRFIEDAGGKVVLVEPDSLKG